MDTQLATSPPIGGRRPQAHVLADYSGRPAAAVADELRRIGLRPGVQRVDAATPGEVGAILAQDPPAGAAAARNSVITLYVGAAAHDPALSERPAAHQPPDATAAAAGPRRRRKPGHAHTHTLAEGPATLDAAAPTDRDAEHLEAADTYQDGNAAADGSDPLEARQVDVGSQDDLAPDARRVHHAAPPPASPPPGEASVGAAGSPPALDARTLLTPLSGLPRPFAPKRWRRVPRRARLAITSALICALALLALALADHHQPAPRRPATATATRPASRTIAKPPSAKPPMVTRGSPRSRGQSGRPRVRGRARRGSRPARAARPPRAYTPAPPPAPAATPVTPPAAPPVAAPVAPAVQAPAPAAPTPASAPVAVGGQIPGGPFSP